MYVYRAEILRVVDGDTVHARVDLGFDVREDMTLRLAHINAPEMRTPEGPPAKEHLLALLAESGAFIFVQTIKDRREKYGRYLATLWAAEPGSILDAASLNDRMVADGFAVSYM